MAKRSGLGQRGLDLLISGSPGESSRGRSEDKSSSKKKTGEKKSSSTRSKTASSSKSAKSKSAQKKTSSSSKKSTSASRKRSVSKKEEVNNVKTNLENVSIEGAYNEDMITAENSSELESSERINQVQDTQLDTMTDEAKGNLSEEADMISADESVLEEDEFSGKGKETSGEEDEFSDEGEELSGEGEKISDEGEELSDEEKELSGEEDEFLGEEDRLLDEDSSEDEEITSASDRTDQSREVVSNEPLMIPISRVEPNRSQPRKNFDEDALQELADSIRQFGVIQPLIVQKKEDYYEIIAGERRWRAARLASLKEVPVIVKDYTPREVMEISLIENIQREDLNPIEEAAAFRRLMNEYELKQDEVAQRVSKSRAAIANSIRLLNLDERVQDMVVAEMLSTGHARALLAITDPEIQYQTAQKVFDEKLTVRDVEKLVKKMNQAPVSPVRKQISEALQAVYLDLSEKMKVSLGTKVSIAPKSAQKGKIEIEYYSQDELDRLCSLLNGLGQREEV